MSTSDANASRKADLAKSVARLADVSQQLGGKGSGPEPAVGGRASRDMGYDCGQWVAITSEFATAAQVALDGGNLETAGWLLSLGQSYANIAADCLAAG